MKLKNKKVLITGAAGFIGSHLAERLVRNQCQVRAMVHYNSQGRCGNLELLPDNIKKSIEIYSGDVCDIINVKNAIKGCEIVFHLAALVSIPYSYNCPHSFVNTNVMGTLNVMQSCLENNVKKVIHTSSSEVYGTARYVPMDENHPLQGQSPYSASKIGADKIAESFFKTYELPVTIIRPFNTYGPRQSARAVIPAIVAQILSGKETIKIGSLEPVRDFNFVNDTIDGFIKIAQSGNISGEVINIGSGKGITVRELINHITKITQKKVLISSDKKRIRPIKSEVTKLICANGKARKLIGWEPKYTIEEGLSITVDFIRNNLNLYNSEIYNI